MNKNGPVIIIEDDNDDMELLNVIFKKLGYPNEVIFFEDGKKPLAYITREDVLPFLLLFDINMSRIIGLELKRKIHTDEQL